MACLSDLPGLEGTSKAYQIFQMLTSHIQADIIQKWFPAIAFATSCLHYCSTCLFMWISSCFFAAQSALIQSQHCLTNSSSELEALLFLLLCLWLSTVFSILVGEGISLRASLIVLCSNSISASDLVVSVSHFRLLSPPFAWLEMLFWRCFVKVMLLLLAVQSPGLNVAAILFFISSLTDQARQRKICDSSRKACINSAACVPFVMQIVLPQEAGSAVLAMSILSL